MKNSSYRLDLTFEQILQLIRQLPTVDKLKLYEELEHISLENVPTISDEKIKEVLRNIKPYFGDKLGKYTHKKHTEDYYFYALAFSRADMGYLFGFNIGFFHHDDKTQYQNAGMNVLITTNKENVDLRERYLNFFRDSLNPWINQKERIFTYPERGDVGIEFARYRGVDSFNNDNEIMEYFKESIDMLQKIYPSIINNAKVFEKVVRAAPRWNENLVEICKTHFS